MLLDRLFVIFRDAIDEHTADPVPLVVLEVLEFDMRKLGITRVLCVDPHEVWKTRRPDKVALVEHLVGRQYCSFGQACQCVYAAYQGKEVRTVYMERFEVYLRSPEVDPALIGATTNTRICHGEQVVQQGSPALAAARVESLEIPPIAGLQSAHGAPWEGWINVGSGRPYAHSSTAPRDAEKLVEQMLREVCCLFSRQPG